MNNLPHKPEDKLLAMVDNVVVRRNQHKCARIAGDTQMEVRQYGRLDKSVDDLAKAAEKFRKAGER